MGTRERLAPLTGLRGVAAYAVLLGHALDTMFTRNGHALLEPASGRIAYFGMSLFFVLSGFVITYNYTPLFANGPSPKAIRKFFAARFARLYPLYVLSLLALGPGVFTAWTFLSYATLTQSWFNVELASFPPDWSLSTEWFFYCTFVPLALFVRPSERPLRAMVFATAASALVIMVLFGPLSGINAAVAKSLFWHNARISADASGWEIYFAPYVRLPEFLLGMFAARAFTLNQRVAPVAGTLGASWCVAVICIGPLTHAASPLHALLSNFVFAPAIAVAALATCQNEKAPLARLLSSRPLVFAGEISFSVYIWSWAAMETIRDHVRTDALPQDVLAIALIGLVTTAFAYGSFLLIEKPSRQWLRQTLGS